MRRALPLSPLSLASPPRARRVRRPPALPAAAGPPAAPEVPVASTTSARVEQVPAPRDDGRLPASAFPRHYALTLSVDPTQERFQGQVTIDVDLPSATSHVVLHGRDLNDHGRDRDDRERGARRHGGVARCRTTASWPRR